LYIWKLLKEEILKGLITKKSCHYVWWEMVTRRKVIKILNKCKLYSVYINIFLRTLHVSLHEIELENILRVYLGYIYYQLLTLNKSFNISETQFVIYTKNNNSYLMELLEGLKLLSGGHLANLSIQSVRILINPLFSYLQTKIYGRHLVFFWLYSEFHVCHNYNNRTRKPQILILEL